MTNGQYSVTGGFWVLPVAVQSVGAPLLTIVPAAPGQAAIVTAFFGVAKVSKLAS